MKIIIWKKKAATLVAAALAVSIAGYAASYPVEASAADRQLPIYCVDKGQQKVCSISFDAAWGNAILRRWFASRRGVYVRFSPPASSRGRSSSEKR